MPSLPMDTRHIHNYALAACVYAASLLLHATACPLLAQLPRLRFGQWAPATSTSTSPHPPPSCPRRFVTADTRLPAVYALPAQPL
jgi:hypothetical protein